MPESSAEPRFSKKIAGIILGTCLLVAIAFVVLLPGKKDSAQHSGATEQPTPPEQAEISSPSSQPPVVVPASAPKGQGRDWLKIEDIDGLPALAYIDTESATRNAEGNVVIWQKFVYPYSSAASFSSRRYLRDHGLPSDNYASDQSLIEVDCVNRIWRQKKLGFFDTGDREIGHSTSEQLELDWQESPSGSIGLAVVNRVCELGIARG